MTAEPTTDTRQLTSTVIAVILRVAGMVTIDVRSHAIGTPQRQVTARIGDALLYLTDPRTVARVRQQWDAAQYIAARRLPETVSQTWLANPQPQTYPLGVTLRLEGPVPVTSRWMAGSPTTGTPPHLRTGSTDSYSRSAICRRGRRSATLGSTPSATSSSDRAPLVWTTNRVIHTSGSLAWHRMSSARTCGHGLVERMPMEHHLD